MLFPFCRVVLGVFLFIVFAMPLAFNKADELVEENFKPAEVEAGAKRREAAIAEATNDLKSAEEQRSIAIRRRSMDQAKHLAAQMTALRAELRELRKTKPSDFAEIIRQEQAEKKVERESVAAAEALRKVLPPLSELAEGCPVAVYDCQMIKNSAIALFKEYGALEATRLGVHRYEGHPKLIVRVICTGDNPVESFEVSFEVFDSFEKKLQNRQTGSHVFVHQEAVSRPLATGQTETAVNWGSKDYLDAFTARAWVSRARLADGTLWEQTREEAEKRNHGIRMAERVDVWIQRECRDEP